MRKENELSDNLYAPGPEKNPGDFAKKITEKISEEMSQKRSPKVFFPDKKTKKKIKKSEKDEKKDLSDEFYAPGPEKAPGNFAKDITREISERFQSAKETEKKLSEMLREADLVFRVLSIRGIKDFEFAKMKVHDFFQKRFFKDKQPLLVLSVIDMTISNFQAEKDNVRESINLKIRPEEDIQRLKDLEKEIDKRIEFLLEEKKYFRKFID